MTQIKLKNIIVWLEKTREFISAILQDIKKKYSEFWNRKHTLEFLPAALEIQETPPTPLGRAIIWVIIAFFTTAVVWAVIAEVDVVAVAQGKIVPGDRVKVIQPLETGVVKQIHVKEGQNIEKGQLLVELDTTASGADRHRQANELVGLELDRIRLHALLEAVNTLETSQKSTLVSNKLSPRLEVPDNLKIEETQIQIQQQRLDKQFEEYKARIAALKDQSAQQSAERKAVEERIAQLNATIPLITERTASYEKLLKTNMVPRVQWLEIEEQRITQVKERDVQKSKYNQLVSALSGTAEQRIALVAQIEGQWLIELSEIESKISFLEQEQIKTEQRFDLQSLVSPVKGTVQQLSIHTIGGVVTPAQQLMLIVSEGGGLAVEAWIQNKDIGFVNAGQQAEIKIETFPFTRYGVIDAEIITISNDAIQSEELGLVYAA